MKDIIFSVDVAISKDFNDFQFLQSLLFCQEHNLTNNLYNIS